MPPKYILIVGSADKCCDSTRLSRATAFVKALTMEVVNTGNAVAVLASREPVRVDQDISKPLTFDWEVLRAVDRHLEQTDNRAGYNLARVFMGADSMERRFTPENTRLIQSLQERGAIDIKHIDEDIYSGGEYRDWQADFCDAMIAIGGGKGTYQIADKMLSMGKPVIPMDIQIGARHRDGEGSLKLLKEFKSDEKTFLPRSHNVLRANLYALSLESPYWKTRRIAYSVAQILTLELQDLIAEDRTLWSRTQHLILRILKRSPQIAQSSLQISKTAETIEELFQ